MNWLEIPENPLPTRLDYLLMELAIGFVNVPPGELDNAILTALRMTGEFTGVDRSYLFLYDFAAGTTTNTHEWCAEGIDPMINELQEVPICDIPEWIGTHLDGRTVHIPSIPALPEDSALRAILAPQGILSLVAVPLVSGRDCIGFVGFDAVRQCKVWTDAELKLLRMLAELFTNAENGRRRNLALDCARQSAEAAERLLRRAVEAEKAAIWQADFGSRVVHCFAGWGHLLGDDLDGRRLNLRAMAKRAHPEDLGPMLRSFGNCAMHRESHCQGILRLRHAAGHWLQVQIKACLEYDLKGIPGIVSGSATDVSAQAHEQQEIRLWLEIERRLAAISARFVDTQGFDLAVHEALADIGGLCGACRADVFLFDNHHRTMTNTHEWCATGVESQKHSSTLVPVEADSECLRQLMAGDVLQLPDIEAMDLSSFPQRDLLLKQGVRSVVSVPMKVGGRLEGFIGLENTRRAHCWSLPQISALRSCAEIVAGALARNRSQVELRASENLHRTILDNLREAVFMTNAAGHITFVNRSWQDVTGLPPCRGVGSRLRDLLAPGQANDENLRFGEIMKGRSLPDHVVRLSDGDSNRWVSLVRVPLLSAEGGLLGTIGTMVDVTERRNWEEKLVMDKIRAESANEAKTAYLSNISHELRTPMHGVLGMLELVLAAGSLDPADTTKVIAAHASAKALVRLLDDILDVARSERGMLTLREAPMNPAVVLQEVVGIFQQEASANAVELTTHVAADVPKDMVGDEFRIRQIATNLIDNAIKFSPGGKVHVELRTSEPAGAGTSAQRVKHLRLEVLDTGMGIEPEAMANIYKPFFRAGHQKHRHIGGSGLGLPIVRDIVNLMNGSIGIDSEPGKGTTVRVDIPAKPSQRRDPAARPRSMGTAGEFAGLRVLVAEDNEINCVVAKMLLEQLGCSVSVAKHGGEAIEACAVQRFDVVLMDCLMPGIDGFEAAREIRRATPDDAPVIFGCTANNNSRVEKMCLDCGMRAVVGKPYSLVDLVGLLSSLEGWRPPLGVPSARDGNGLDEPLFDCETFEELARYAGGIAALAARMLPVFRNNSADLVSAAAEAYQAGNLVAMQRAAHTLKGSAAALGARRLAELASRIMQYPSEGKPSAANPPLAGLLDLLEPLRRATLCELQEMAAGAAASPRAAQ